MNNKVPKQFTTGDLETQHGEQFEQNEDELLEIFMDRILDDLELFRTLGHGNYSYGTPYFEENRTKFLVPFVKCR